MDGPPAQGSGCNNVGSQGILVELPLAGFVLKKLLGQAMDVADLTSLDNDLYRNLMFLRDYEGNVEDLCLNFTINRNDLEENVEVCSG
jgi:ubiquitin-protein ligase E3 C